MNDYTNYLKKLKSVCNKRKILLVEIGQINNLPIYKVTLNPLASKVVVFSAGIHGDEIAGPWTIIDFLKQFNPQNYLDVKIILFPVASPTAFDKKKRYSYLGKDLNRLFCRKKLSSENRILFQNLKYEKVFFFHALHEDVDEYSFYLYNFENKKEKIYCDIIQLAKNHFPINNSIQIYNNPAVKGLIINRPDGSFEDRMFQDGVPFSMCTETPGKQPLKKRVILNVEIMNKIIDFTSRQ
jgi:hypothetical protein